MGTGRRRGRGTASGPGRASIVSVDINGAWLTMGAHGRDEAPVWDCASSANAGARVIGTATCCGRGGGADGVRIGDAAELMTASISRRAAAVASLAASWDASVDAGCTIAMGGEIYSRMNQKMTTSASSTGTTTAAIHRSCHPSQGSWIERA